MPSLKFLAKVRHRLFLRSPLPEILDALATVPTLDVRAPGEGVLQGILRDVYGGDPWSGVIAEIAKECIDEGVAHFFSRQAVLEDGFSPSLGGAVAPPPPHWSKVNLGRYRGDRDVKFTWEASRLEDLDALVTWSVLADDPRGCREGERWVARWRDQNPLHRGVNWYSNMEVALRLIRMLVLLIVARDQGVETPATQRSVEEHSARLRRHVASTRRTMGGNHYLIEALALAIVEICTGGGGPWLRRFIEEADAQFFPDGGHIEGSIGYHAYALDGLCVLGLLGSAFDFGLEDVRPIAWRALSFAEAMMDPRGLVPNIGDWDDGRVWRPVRGQPRDLRDLIRLGRRVFGPVVSDAGGAAEPAGWKIFPQSGLARGTTRAGAGLLATTFRAGAVAWGHSHLDMLQVTASDRIGDWFIDSGTGYYNRDPATRLHYRSPAAHSSLQSATDQLPLRPRRTFGWRGTLRAVLRLVSADAVEGAYAHPLAGTLRRKVSLLEDGLLIEDEWSGPHPVRQRFITPEGIRATLEPGGVVLTRAKDGVIAEMLVNGRPVVAEVGYSTAYGEVRSGTVVDVDFDGQARGSGSVRIRWRPRQADHARAMPGTG